MSTNYVNNLENKKKYKYIYNTKQALYFIKNGADIEHRNIGINKKSGNVFFKFTNNNNLQKIFEEWNTLCKENK